MLKQSISSMQVVACGINHKTAPLSLRERLAFDPKNALSALRAFVAKGHGTEAALLSTCNRTEIYCTQRTTSPLISWISQYCKLDPQLLQPHLYCHHNQAAITHMLRVASGLDSMVLGETQIFQQMKQAYQVASQAGTLGSVLHHLFQYVFQSTKQIRHQTAISANPISIAFTAASLAKRIFTSLSDTTVMLLGAGDTIALTAKYLKQHGCEKLLVANRTPAHAKQLALELHAEVLSIDHLIHRLHEADILISATSSRLPIIGKGSIESALKQRKHSPMYLIDLAVPRDIEPQVNELSDAYLYCIDDLKELVEQGLQHRKAAAQHAEQIITAQSTQFMQSIHALESVNIIKALRERSTQHKQQCIDQALLELKRGKSIEAVITQISTQLTNKLLHVPCKQLHTAASQQDQTLLEAATRLFQLNFNEEKD